MLLDTKDIGFLTRAATVFSFFIVLIFCFVFVLSVFVATGELIGVKYLYAQTEQVL